MMDSQYIGRGEILFSKILQTMFPKAIIYPQFALKKLLSEQEYKELHETLKKHKFDFLVVSNAVTYAIEINYKHKSRAAVKWGHYKKILMKRHIVPVTVDHFNCRSSLRGVRGLFQLTADKRHLDSWNDWRDIIDALEKAGVPVPKLSQE